MEEKSSYTTHDYCEHYRETKVKENLREKIEHLYFIGEIAPDVYRDLIVLVKQL